MGPGQKFLTRPGQFFVARVGSGQPFMVWVRIQKIQAKNVKFFNFFPSGQKKLLRVGSGQGPSLIGLLLLLLLYSFVFFYSYEEIAC